MLSLASFFFDLHATHSCQDPFPELLLDGVKYFQIVFTLPSQLASFSLGNRGPMFDLLLKAAWQGLDELLRETLGVAPAAAMVLHTWNQELDVHPHVHALVPGSFPSLDGQQWITPQHPKHKRRRKPYLCDNTQLSERFRSKFVAGLERLFKQGKLKFQSEASAQQAAFDAWIKELSELDWNVYIQGPPSKDSDPAHVAKYLARYMTGGPISDSRIISHDEGQVVFWARSRDKKNQSRPFRLSGRQFVHRWSQHILPKGFTKSRTYGGYHNTKRADYLKLCRSLAPPQHEKVDHVSQPQPPDDMRPPERKCPHCESSLVRFGEPTRPAWREVLSGPSCPEWYQAFMSGHGPAIRWYRDGY